LYENTVVNTTTNRGTATGQDLDFTLPGKDGGISEVYSPFSGLADEFLLPVSMISY